MRQFTEEATPVRIIGRGKVEGIDTHWRICTYGDDEMRRFQVSITGPVIKFLEQSPHEYDIDDIAIVFAEMAFDHGHKEGEFAIAAESPEYAHLIAHLRKFE